VNDLTTQYICGNNGDAYDVAAASLSNGADWWYEPWSTKSDSGVAVNGYTALQNSHVWKALNVLASDFGQLPVKLFQKVGGKTVEVEGTPEIDCLRIAPNEWTLPSVYKETSMWVAALWGNSITWVNRPNPRTIQLVPLRPDRVSLDIVDDIKGQFTYVYTLANGTHVPLNQADVLHIPGITSNGIWGYSLLDIARNAIGGGLAMEKHQNASFANGARPSGVIEHPGKPDAKSRDALRQSWDAVHKGSGNAGRVAILWDGMKYSPVTMTMETAQVEQLRRLDREFVAGLFNLPLYKLNSLEHSSTRSNLEQQQQEYVQGSLMRWIVRHTEEWGRKLLTPAMQRQGFFYRVMIEALLRGDTQSRFSAYGVAIQNRIMNPNEVREKEDMPPYAGGEEYGNPNIDKLAANNADNQGGRLPGSSERARALLADKVEHVVKTECNAVCRGASSKDFVGWVETYYGLGGGFFKLVAKELQPLAAFVTEVATDIEFDSVLWASVHAAESQRLLAAIMARSTKDTLADGVRGECEKWAARASL